jgi:peptidoglycan hydrolase-like protein with peptidoglycan-binding domain
MKHERWLGTIAYSRPTARRFGARAGSAARLVVDVATLVSGVGSLPALWALISQMMLRHGQVRTVPGELAAQSSPVTINGIFGANTEAVKAQQKAFRLSQSGVVDDNTWAKLVEG